MKKILLFSLPILIGAGLFYWVIRTVGWQEIRKSFLVFGGWQGLAILALTLLAFLLGTFVWQEVLKGMGARVSFKKLWQAYLAGFSIRYLVPMVIIGSEVFQGHILKEMDSITWEKSMASVIIHRILELTISLMVIFFGIPFFLMKIGLPPLKLAFIFGGIVLVLTVLIFYFYFKSFKRESMAKAIGRIFNNKLDTKPLEIEKEIFSFFKIRKLTMWKSFILSFLRVLIMWFRTWLLILFLGKSLTALPALSILGFYSLVTMIPIPADLGSHEAIQAFAFSSLGLNAGTGTAFALITRGAELIVSLIGIIILFRLGLEMIKNTLFKKTERQPLNFVVNKKES
jgi:uncharacterized protein (TIRG00374 family)